MQEYKGFGGRAVNVRVSLKIRRVQHRKFGGVLRQFFQIQLANKHSAGKQGGGSPLTYDANGKAIILVRSRVAVFNEDIFPLEIRAQPGLESVELRRVQRSIDFAPADLAFAGRFTDEKLVFRQTAGVLASAHDQRAQMTQVGFIAANGLFVKRRSGQIPVDLAEIGEAEAFKAFFLRFGRCSNCVHRLILQRTGSADRQCPSMEANSRVFNRESARQSKPTPKRDALPIWFLSSSTDTHAAHNMPLAIYTIYGILAGWRGRLKSATNLPNGNGN